jgi:ATP-binding cassette, subfamily F, member 3
MDLLIDVFAVLSVALADSDPGKVSVAVATVQLSRARKELEQAQSIASRRSGARGAEARKLVPPAEAKVADVEAK